MYGVGGRCEGEAPAGVGETSIADVLLKPGEANLCLSIQFVQHC